MRPLLLGLVIAVGFAPQAPGLAQTPAAPKVQLTFEPGGLVTLVANGATVREVLTEWTRKGGTPFVGSEKLTGSTLTVQFDHRPETEVIGSLLRTAAGVVIAPKADDATGASSLGVVFVIATSNATAGGYSQPTYTAPQPQMSTGGSPDQEIPPAGPGRSGEPPQQAPPPAPRPAGSGVAVSVVPVTVPIATAPPPTAGTPPPATGTATGSGRGGGRGR